MRKLATIRTIDEIKPIENADAIEHVRVDGWWVVCKKSEFQVGQKALYLEVDSWVPETLAPFLSKGRTYNEVVGERLRTIKLRGALSQGLILPLQPEWLEIEDLDAYLGIQLWEKPVHASLRGLVKGNFPQFVRKTDQPRIQNLPEVLEDQLSLYEVTLKLDGSSTSVICKDGVVGVCSRNLELKLEDTNNTFVVASAEWQEIVRKIYDDTGRNLALQGELMGPGVQGNRENLQKHTLFLYDIWDIDNQQYLGCTERWELASTYNIRHIPIIFYKISLGALSCTTMDEILALADKLDNAGWTDPIEGVVFKRIDGQFSFKIINNRFLLKEK